jgi:hypothetical protein
VSHGTDDIRTTAGQGPEPRPRRAALGGLLARLSSANVAATLALAVALGGTATAATTLARDSVGSAQIKTDAVRSPEIAKDAVRSPEIRADAVRSPEIAAGAVRSSEIRDGGIRLDDISPGAQAALGAPRVRLAEDDFADVPGCSSALTVCPNLVSLTVPSASWLVQAKFSMRNDGNPATLATVCGLVQSDTTVLDSVQAASLDVRGTPGSSQAAELTAVASDVPQGTRIALRCTERPGEHVVLDGVRITALEVGSVGP